MLGIFETLEHVYFGHPFNNAIERPTRKVDSVGLPELSVFLGWKNGRTGISGWRWPRCCIVVRGRLGCYLVGLILENELLETELAVESSGRQMTRLQRVEKRGFRR